MRLYTIILIIIACSSLASAESNNSPFRNVIETDSNTNLRNRDLFRPDSGLTVELDGAFLQRRLGDSSQAKELADQIEDIYQLSLATNASLAKLKELSETKDPEAYTFVLGGISPLFNQVKSILKKRYPNDAKNLSDSINKKGAPIEENLKLIFESASTIADRSSIAINQLMPKVSVRLQLSRDADQSRQPSQPFGVLPNADTVKKVEALQNAGGLASTPQTIKQQFTKDASTLIDKARKQFDLYEQNANAILKGIGENNATIETINTNLGKVKSSYESLATAVEEVTKDDQSISLAERVSRAALVPSLAQNFVDLLIKQKEGFEGLNTENATQEAEDARTAIVKLLNEIKDSGKTFGDTAWQSAIATLNANLELLNLRAKLEQIGETLQEAKDGKAQFDNNDGSLGGMAKMRSYDEIRISVVQMTDPAKPVQVGPPFYLIAWQPNRWDNITALGYYRKGDNKWAAAPIFGQVFKCYSKRKYDDARICPGIGYSIMTLDQNDDSQVEVGVGATLSLFDDHIVGGLGYNTSGKGQYWFAGYRVRIN